MDITAVIPHSRSVELLWATYASAKQAGVHKFVIVHNGIEPKPFQAEDVADVFIGSHIGPAKAREEGARFVTSEYILFLDDDSVIPSDLFEDVPEADCVIYPSTTWGTYTHYDYDEPIPGTKLMDYAAKMYPGSTKPYPCYSGPNGAMLFKREAWQKINGYGGLVDGYGPDEILLGYRMKGLKVLMDPRYTVWHYPSFESYKNRDELMVERFRKAQEIVCP